MAKTSTEQKTLGTKFLQLFINYKILKTNFTVVIITIFLLAALHFALAIAMYVVGRSLMDRRLGISEGCFTLPCTLNFKLLETVKEPIHLYIAYEDFYLNHRKVMTSIDTRQLDGKSLSVDELKTACGEYVTIGDAQRFIDNPTQNESSAKLLALCGLFPMLFTEC